MDEEGHQIGLHTYDHVRLTDLNRTDFNAQVEKSRALLKQGCWTQRFFAASSLWNAG
ncbi:MAG: polysaccharide deacetylase family protein [Oscillospiraceae bacterium]